MPPTLGHSGNLLPFAERRPHARLTPNSLVYVELCEGNGGFVVNISESGMAVQAAQVVHDQLLECMRLKLPRSPDKLELGGRIAWRGETRKKLGIQFVDLPEAARDQIKRWISSEASGGESPQKINKTVERKLQPPVVPIAAESEDKLRECISPERIAETQKPYPISFAMTVAFREDPAPVEIPLQLDSLLDVLSQIVPPELTPQTPPPIPPALSDAAPAIPDASGNDTFSSPVQTSDSTASSKSILAGPEAVHAPVPRTSAPPKHWMARAVLGSLLIIAVFAGGIAVGRRGSKQAAENIKKSTPSSSPLVSSTANEKVPIASGSDSVAPASRRSAESLTNPAPRIAQDEGAYIRNPPANTGRVEHRLPENPTGQNLASVRPESQSDGSAVSSPVIAQQQVAPLSESPASTAEVRQENLPMPPASKNLEIVTGSVAISSHFRSIRLPSELRSRTSQLGNSLQIGRPISSEQPAYPADALEKRIEGTVRLHAIIGRDGTVQTVEAVSGPAPLLSAAMTAVRGWRYNRSFVGDQPVEREEDITLVFRLRTQMTAPN